MADFKKEGSLDIHQWRLFYDIFINKFQEFDKDNDNYIDDKELKESLKDISWMVDL